MAGQSEALFELGLSCRMGLVRRNNEDNYYFNGLYKTPELENTDMELAQTTRDPLVVAVCDGMGGASFGEHAAWLAVNTLSDYAQELLAREDPSDLVDQCICQINRDIHNEGLRRVCQMGCTMVMAVVHHGLVRIYNVGDSRAYLWSDGELRQLSRDHTMGQELRNMGMKPRKSEDHKLTQFLGMGEEDMVTVPYQAVTRLRNNDRLLLCSDGLTDLLAETEISMLLSDNKAANVQAMRLTRAAERAGGSDNVTALVLASGSQAWDELGGKA